jgi:signal peptidase II
MKESFAKRLSILLVIGVLVATLDLGTKEWADRRLASERHPLPAVVGADDVGKTTETFLAEKWDFLSEDELTTALGKRRVRVIQRPDEALAPDLKPYGKDPKTLSWRGVYVFHRQDFEQSPRRIEFNDTPYLMHWLEPNLSGESRDERLISIRAYLAEITLTDLLERRDPSLSRRSSALPKLIAEYTVPWSKTRDRVREDTPVSAGQIYLLEERVVDVIPGFWRYVYRENPNGAWGFLSGMDETTRGWFLTVFSVLAMFVIVIIFFRLEEGQALDLYVFAAIFGGAIGNIIDRFRYTFVIDFIDNYVGQNHWPTYNVADIAITVGVILLFLQALRRGNPEKEGEKG